MNRTHLMRFVAPAGLALAPPPSSGGAAGASAELGAPAGAGAPVAFRAEAGVAAPARRGLPWSARLLLSALDRICVGELLLTLPSGERRGFGARAPGNAGAALRAELRIHDWRACERIVRAGDIGFGDALHRGWLDSPDFTALICLAMRNESLIASTVWGGPVSRLWYRLRHGLRRNSRSGSRHNIHAHYDIGNDFYGLWLDESWTYSAALFRGRAELSLEAAQQAKYQRVIDKLGLRPGMRVLEIGCGWGGFARHAARQGIAVHGVTISPAQLGLAQQRVAAEGLQDLARLELRDYRDLRGRYDALVSIEMFEAVGQAYWRDWFATVGRLLVPGGQALVQSITIAETRFAQYRATSDFIRHFIFPGGMLPTPGRFVAGAARVGLVTRDMLAFGKDYAQTIRHWRERFEGAGPAILALGLDQPFVRLWRLYLAYCEAGFEEGRTDVFQFVLQRE